MTMTGAPIAIPEFNIQDTKDPASYIPSNDFVYNDEICPVSAHIRKTNIRENVTGNDMDPRAPRTKMIRSGIPYGPDYEGHESDNSTRGLLFTCYQGSIEDAFENMQSA